MRVVVQRVDSASVSVDGDEIARIGPGFVVLAAFTEQDDDSVLQWMARKVTSLRVFEDEEGKMNRNLEAVGGDILVVSQFTLYGDCKKGARPSFVRSAQPDKARSLYERFVDILAAEAPGRVESGSFQAHMSVALTNDGPVTLVIDKEAD